VKWGLEKHGFLLLFEIRKYGYGVWKTRVLYEIWKTLDFIAKWSLEKTRVLSRDRENMVFIRQMLFGKTFALFPRWFLEKNMG